MDASDRDFAIYVGLGGAVLVAGLAAWKATEVTVVRDGAVTSHKSHVTFNFNALRACLPETPRTFLEARGAEPYPPLVADLVREYRDLERRIAHAYEAGRTPAALEAAAAEVLARAEGALAALEEEGEDPSEDWVGTGEEPSPAYLRHVERLRGRPPGRAVEEAESFLRVKRRR